LRLIDYFSCKGKLLKRLNNQKGSTFILILMTFLPVLIVLTYLGLQFRNTSNAFMELRNDKQAYYVAEMGIERYKNQVVGDNAYADVMNFSKVIGSETYSVEVTSSRISSGESEKIKIISTVLDLNISTERTISISRF